MLTIRLRTASLMAVLLTLPILACGEDEDDNPCASTMNLNSAASTEAGVVTVSGSFAENESIFLRYTAGGNAQTVFGAVDETTVSFSGLPTGELFMTFVMACGKVAVEHTVGTKTVAVQ